MGAPAIFTLYLTSSIRTGTPRRSDSVAASAIQATSTASATVHAEARRALDHLDERGQFGAERLGEAVHEEVVRWVLAVDAPRRIEVAQAVQPVYFGWPSRSSSPAARTTRSNPRTMVLC